MGDVVPAVPGGVRRAAEAVRPIKGRVTFGDHQEWTRLKALYGLLTLQAAMTLSWSTVTYPVTGVSHSGRLVSLVRAAALG